MNTNEYVYYKVCTSIYRYQHGIYILEFYMGIINGWCKSTWDITWLMNNQDKEKLNKEDIFLILL